MHLFPNTRIFVSFGSLEIAWYAVLILTGALCAYLLCQRTMKKWGYAPEVLDDYVVPMLFIGILGARAWYVIFEWNYYSSHLNEIVAIWNGGLAIHGGLIAGTIFSLFFFKRRKISFLRMFFDSLHLSYTSFLPPKGNTFVTFLSSKNFFKISI